MDGVGIMMDKTEIGDRNNGREGGSWLLGYVIVRESLRQWNCHDPMAARKRMELISPRVFA